MVFNDRAAVSETVTSADRRWAVQLGAGGGVRIALGHRPLPARRRARAGPDHRRNGGTVRHGRQELPALGGRRGRPAHARRRLRAVRARRRRPRGAVVAGPPRRPGGAGRRTPGARPGRCPGRRRAGGRGRHPAGRHPALAVRPRPARPLRRCLRDVPGVPGPARAARDGGRAVRPAARRWPRCPTDIAHLFQPTTLAAFFGRLTDSQGWTSFFTSPDGRSTTSLRLRLRAYRPRRNWPVRTRRSSTTSSRYAVMSGSGRPAGPSRRRPPSDRRSGSVPTPAVRSSQRRCRRPRKPPRR
ncbi:hypothetical protein SFUMM280S_01405 [Streptomyces fumanus]